MILRESYSPRAHSNVGGGCADSGLSDVAFLWIKDKAERCGLVFNEDYVRANIYPNVSGDLRDSKTGIYRLIPDYLRPIGAVGTGEEAVHRSAVERMERRARPAYSPPNLTKYLKAGGRVTA